MDKASLRSWIGQSRGACTLLTVLSLGRHAESSVRSGCKFVIFSSLLRRLCLGCVIGDAGPKVPCAIQAEIAISLVRRTKSQGDLIIQACPCKPLDMPRAKEQLQAAYKAVVCHRQTSAALLIESSMKDFVGHHRTTEMPARGARTQSPL